MAECKSCGKENDYICEECVAPLCVECANVCYCNRTLCDEHIKPDGDIPCMACRGRGIKRGERLPLSDD